MLTSERQQPSGTPVLLCERCACLCTRVCVHLFPFVCFACDIHVRMACSSEWEEKCVFMCPQQHSVTLVRRHPMTDVVVWWQSNTDTHEACHKNTNMAASGITIEQSIDTTSLKTDTTPLWWKTFKSTWRCSPAWKVKSMSLRHQNMFSSESSINGANLKQNKDFSYSSFVLSLHFKTVVKNA